MAKKAKLGSGSRFQALVSDIMKPGKGKKKSKYSEESAKAIAATVGRKKYGAKRFAELSRKGKK
jgi:hypothetical protein